MEHLEDPTPVTVQSEIRFCNRCGAGWQPDWVACVFCAASTAAPPVSSGPQSYEELVSVKSSLWLYFALLAVSIVSLFIGLTSKEGLPVEAELVIEALMSVITVCYAISWRRAVFPSLKRTGPWGYLLLAPMLAVGTFLFATLAMRGLVAITEIELLDYSSEYLYAGYGWGIIFLSVAVQPAVIEELAFRGVILPTLSRSMSSGEAIVVSAMMFAILHLSIPSLPHLIAIGLALGWLRQKTGSLYPCMLLHFTHNSLVLLSERYGSDFGY